MNRKIIPFPTRARTFSESYIELLSRKLTEQEKIDGIPKITKRKPPRDR